MDQLLKKKFEQFQPPPPESVWSGVKSGIPVSSTGFMTKLVASKYFLSMVAATVIIIGVLILPTILKRDTINDPDVTNAGNIVSQQRQQQQQSSGSTETEFKAEENTKDTGHNSIPQVDILPSETEITQVIELSDTQSYNVSSDPQDADPVTNEHSEIISYQSLSILPAITTNNIELALIFPTIETVQTDQQIVGYGLIKSSKWDLGVFYFRERIYFPEDKDEVNHKISQSFELTGRYHFSEFFIQSGLGLAISEDDGDCRIDYKKYELTGTYEDVFDVTFDSTNQGMVPVFHTQTIEVYDTLFQKKHTPMDHKYTYIQVPLLFGYEQSISGRFFYNLKLGPLLAIMICDDESDIDYPTGHLDITNVYKPLPTRVKTSWQFMLGVGMGYNISNHVSLSIEPALKYYLGSGYKSTDMVTRHPYSFGLRGGITYRF